MPKTLFLVQTPTGGSGLSTGAILGIIIASILVLIIIFKCICHLWCKNQDTSSTLESESQCDPKCRVGCVKDEENVVSKSGRRMRDVGRREEVFRGVQTIDGSISSKVSETTSSWEDSMVSVRNDVKDANIKDEAGSSNLKVLKTEAHCGKSKLAAFQLVRIVNNQNDESSESEGEYATISGGQKSRKNSRVKTGVDNFAYTVDNSDLSDVSLASL